MKAELQWVDGIRFTGLADSNVSVAIDGPLDIGGQDAGIRPMELMLMSIAGCAGVDVVHILRRGRTEIKSCRVLVNARRQTAEPRVFTDIHLTFELSGSNLSETKAVRAINLSAEKYCSASILMQRAGVNISHDLLLV